VRFVGLSALRADIVRVAAFQRVSMKFATGHRPELTETRNLRVQVRKLLMRSLRPSLFRMSHRRNGQQLESGVEVHRQLRVAHHHVLDDLICHINLRKWYTS
jgi:hypothetical protein